MSTPIEQITASLRTVPQIEIYGTVTKVLGLLVEIRGFPQTLSIGARVDLAPQNRQLVPCEVIGFRDNHALLMPFGLLDGIGLGCRAIIRDQDPIVMPDERWLGRVINALAEPIDGLGPLSTGTHPVPLRNTPPPPHARRRMGKHIDLGVRAVNTFTAMRQGQRMGIFSGSGVENRCFYR